MLVNHCLHNQDTFTFIYLFIFFNGVTALRVSVMAGGGGKRLCFTCSRWSVQVGPGVSMSCQHPPVTQWLRAVLLVGVLRDWASTFLYKRVPVAKGKAVSLLMLLFLLPGRVWVRMPGASLSPKPQGQPEQSARAASHFPAPEPVP